MKNESHPARPAPRGLPSLNAVVYIFRVGSPRERRQSDSEQDFLVRPPVGQTS